MPASSMNDIIHQNRDPTKQGPIQQNRDPFNNNSPNIKTVLLLVKMINILDDIISVPLRTLKIISRSPALCESKFKKNSIHNLTGDMSFATKWRNFIRRIETMMIKWLYKLKAIWVTCSGYSMKRSAPPWGNISRNLPFSWRSIR